MKIIGHIPVVVSSRQQKLMGKIVVHQSEHGCLLVELKFSLFGFSVEKRFVKVVYEKMKDNKEN